MHKPKIENKKLQYGILKAARHLILPRDTFLRGGTDSLALRPGTLEGEVSFRASSLRAISFPIITGKYVIFAV